MHTIKVAVLKETFPRERRVAPGVSRFHLSRINNALQGIR